MKKIVKLATKLNKRGKTAQATKILKVAMEEYKPKNFSEAKGNPVVSDELLEAHFGLYQGYVKSLNKILKELQTADRESNGYAHGQFSELRRRLAVPYNGAILHELYFEHLVDAEKSDPSEKLKQLINNRWGSVDKYLEDVKSTALATGNGWVVTAYDPLWDRLENFMVTEHHIGYPVNCTPIMVLDTWEHAFAFDYKTDRKEYVQKFLDNLNYQVMENRLESSSKPKSTEE